MGFTNQLITGGAQPCYKKPTTVHGTMPRVFLLIAML